MTDEPSKPKKLFCFGLGYTAQFLIEALRASGEDWTFAGTTRDLEKRNLLRKQGIAAYVFDTDEALADAQSSFRGVTHMLISTPPDAAGDPVLRAHAPDIARLFRDLEWIGYFSTIGVYGNRDGSWVDETSETIPTSIRGSRRLRAEDEWTKLCKRFNLPLHILRLAGIYGPGRSALDSVRAGIARRIIKEGHVFNRVHVDDIVNVIMQSMSKPSPFATYNIADDEPCASHEVISYACTLLDRPIPPLVRIEDANLAPITQSFYSDNKRVRNTRIKEELGMSLKYPNFRDGLDGCLAYEEAHESFMPSASAESAG